MSLLENLERRIGWFAIPRLTTVIAYAQIVTFGLAFTHPDLVDRLHLIPEHVLEGEWWRVITYVFVSEPVSPIWLLFGLYLFYLMGNSLEHHWGTFRYNIFIWFGAAATAASAFLHPDVPTYSGMIAGSVFLAFAWLAPDFEICIFFVLPVRIKYLAALTWIGFFIAVIVGDWPTRVSVLASVSNFLLFFWLLIWRRILHNKRRMEIGAALSQPRGVVRHRCGTCGINDVERPDVDFRYCSRCKEPTAYCPEHLREHAHAE